MKKRLPCRPFLTPVSHVISHRGDEKGGQDSESCLWNVLVLNFCVTNVHKLRGGQEHQFINSQFPWVRNPGLVSRVLCTGLHKSTTRCPPDVASSAGWSRGRSASSILQIIGRAHSSVMVRLETRCFC